MPQNSHDKLTDFCCAFIVVHVFGAVWKHWEMEETLLQKMQPHSPHRASHLELTLVPHSTLLLICVPYSLLFPHVRSVCIRLQAQASPMVWRGPDDTCLFNHFFPYFMKLTHMGSFAENTVNHAWFVPHTMW